MRAAQLLGEVCRHAVLPFGPAPPLSEVSGGLASSEGKLQHLGVQNPPKKSTLDYAMPIGQATLLSIV